MRDFIRFLLGWPGADDAGRPQIPVRVVLAHVRFPAA
jgi:hypothetical protein